MLPQTLLPDAQAFELDSWDIQTETIILYVRVLQPEVACPDCKQLSTRVHSRYTRTLADLPWASYAVCWRLSVRRFFCDNAECPHVPSQNRSHPR